MPMGGLGAQNSTASNSPTNFRMPKSPGGRNSFSSAEGDEASSETSVSAEEALSRQLSAQQMQNDCPSKHFFCEEHSQVQPFTLKELRTQVFDTYSICAALLTGLSASRFFFDNRQPHEFLSGHGIHSKVHLSFLLQHIHILIASVCTAAGLESMLVFVLCAMYSRSALAMPKVGSKVFEHFLSQTGKQRANAFKFMLGSGVLSSFNVVVNCLTMPTFIVRAEVPAVILDVIAIACALIALIIVVITLHDVGLLLEAASIIFVPQEKLDEYIGEKAALVSAITPGRTNKLPNAGDSSKMPEDSKAMKAKPPPLDV